MLHCTYMKCSKCKKEGHNFIKYAKSKKSGKQYYRCRDCVREHISNYRKTKKGRDNLNKATRSAYRKNPAKAKTRAMTHSLLKQEKIKKIDKCQECNSEETLFIHHNTYDTFLDILWLCMDCHCKKHKSIVL